MIPKYKEIYEFVLSNNEPLNEVVPLYKINVHHYDKMETIHTKNVSVVNTIAAPFIEVEIENQKEYQDYLTTINTYNERSEYIWYILLRELWNKLSTEEFDQCYKKCWDKYHKEGGWDLVAEKMELIVGEFEMEKCHCN